MIGDPPPDTAFPRMPVDHDPTGGGPGASHTAGVPIMVLIALGLALFALFHSRPEEVKEVVESSTRSR